MEIFATNKFLTNFELCADKALVIGELRQLIFDLEQRAATGAPLRNVKPLVGKLRSAGSAFSLSLQEVKLTKRSRIVFDYSAGILKLVAMPKQDTHTVVESLEKLNQTSLNQLFESLGPAPSGFVRQLLNDYVVRPWLPAGQDEEGIDRMVEPELFDGWLRFLDTPQEHLRNELLQLATRNQKGIHLIVGGPGTGKTMVLIDLAFSLYEQTGAAPSVVFPPGVASYLRESGHILPVVDDSKPSRVVLFDDPLSVDDLERRASEAESSGALLIAAIDPTQWHHRKSIERFDRFLKSRNPHIHPLRLGYRQGGKVGSAAISIVESFLSRSSAYAADDRVQIERDRAAQWESVCLRELTFADSQGHFRVIDNTKPPVEMFTTELSRALRFDTARSWPKVLVGCIDKKQLPNGVDEAIQHARESHPTQAVRVRNFSQVGEIRGTEFESVILFIPKGIWTNLTTGIIGAGTEQWNTVTQILAFFTRAENRLSVIVTST